MWWPSLTVVSSALLAFTWRACAYVPAQAVNASDSSTTWDASDNSSLVLTWAGNGGYQTVVSYQLAGNRSLGVSKGALIRVDESDFVSKETHFTDTPWIAMIGCDHNITNMSEEYDIFSYVHDNGAVAALLYSNTSDGCHVNSEYLNSPDAFEHLFDIFTTKSSRIAFLIQSQFSNIQNYSYTIWNPTLLTLAHDSVVAAIHKDAPNNSPYMVADLRAWNATISEDPNDSNPVPTSAATPSSTGSASSSGGSSQTLAMIILYVIVSLVATLFVVVILSGAIRAFRYPERYGMRLYNPTVGGYDGRNRVAGVGRAILDTFPVVKFGRNNNNNNNNRDAQPPTEYSEDLGYTMKTWNDPQFHQSRSSAELLHAQRNHSPLSSVSQPTTTVPRSSADRNLGAHSTQDANSTAPTSVPRGSEDADHLDPAAIGTETCPICIVDFVEGDDLRVLPCEGKHQFHKDCVDPWLLELSTSCPICRQDFQALENMAVAHEEEEDDDDEEDDEEDDRFPPHGPSDPSATPSSRFSRYIRFAQKRRRSRRDPATSTAASESRAGPSTLPTPYTDY